MNDTELLDAAARKIGEINLTAGKYAGKRYVMWQQNLEDMLRLRELALQDHRRSFIDTYTKNADLAPEGMRDRLVQEAFDRAAVITHEDLPNKMIPMPVLDDRKRPIVDDNGKPKYVKKSVEYWMWWASETMPGKLHAMWLAMCAAPGQRELTFSQVCDIFTDAQQDLTQAVKDLAKLNESKLGNESGPPVSPVANEKRNEFLRPIGQQVGL